MAVQTPALRRVFRKNHLSGLICVYGRCPPRMREPDWSVEQGSVGSYSGRPEVFVEYVKIWRWRGLKLPQISCRAGGVERLCGNRRLGCSRQGSQKDRCRDKPNPRYD